MSGPAILKRSPYFRMILFALLVCTGCKKTNTALPYSLSITIAGKPINFFYQAYASWDSFAPYHTELWLQGIDSATQSRFDLAISNDPNLVKPGKYLLDDHVGNIIYYNYETGQSYQSDSMTLNLIFLDSVRVQGNFNGILTLLTPIPNPDVRLTASGTFNLPFH